MQLAIWFGDAGPESSIWWWWLYRERELCEIYFFWGFVV
jgi:hypothetical protein